MQFVIVLKRTEYSISESLFNINSKKLISQFYHIYNAD